ncbi:hypothetical protein JCM18899A_02650 [Nocardioides sp. AN3]
MKKLIASVFAATLIGAGLVTMSGATSANAAVSTVYPNTVNTATKVVGPSRARKGKRVKVQPVVTNHAKGTVTVTIRLNGRVIKRITVAPGATITFKPTKKGTYKISAVFKPAANTPFKASSSPVKVIRVK